MNKRSEPMATESEIAGSLGIATRKLRAAIKAGRIVPDAIAGRGRLKLFRTNLDRLREIISAAETTNT